MKDIAQNRKNLPPSPLSVKCPHYLIPLVRTDIIIFEKFQLFCIEKLKATLKNYLPSSSPEKCPQ